jgi:predicted MFS family arabinose efflux permease
MEENISHAMNTVKGRLLLPALTIARFAVTPPIIASGLLLVDIAATFGQPVGVMGQMRTTSSTLSMIMALAMTVLSVRYRHKSLLLTGLGFITVSALGCYIAPNFTTMIVIYSLVGIGASMVDPMTMALVGTNFPRKDRSRAVGWLIAGNSLSFLVGAPLIAYLAGLGSWRTAFLFWVFPVALLGIGSVIYGLPSRREDNTRTANVDYTASFRAVFTNLSALSCLIGSSLTGASYQAILVYSASFYRQQFSVSRSFASMFVIGGALFFTIGSISCARFVKKYGHKPVIVIAGLIGGLLIASYTNLPSLWFSGSARFLGGLFLAFAFSALSSLTLEQVPEYRGTLMSINSAVMSIGSAIGSFIGGLALLWYGYPLVGISLGSLAISSAIIIHFLAVDPHSESSNTLK